MKYKWIEMHPDEFVQARDAFPVCYLPLGTLEWHGYHLPLGADGIQSEELFKRTALKVGGIVMPMLFLGPDKREEDYMGMDICRENRVEPYANQKLVGSAYWVEDRLFEEMLLQIAYNVSRMGFKVLVAHGHGPSAYAFMKLKDTIEKRYNLICICPFEFINDEYAYMNDHASSNETSILMAIDKDYVHMEYMKDKRGLKGLDPVIYSTLSYGNDIMDRNVETLCKKLQSIINQEE
ncbi:MAG: creatininase family protein [Holdemanella sp.]|nr:creatininase family protein [Holdemanella sp.]